jgi:hypothetical protein
MPDEASLPDDHRATWWLSFEAPRPGATALSEVATPSPGAATSMVPAAVGNRPWWSLADGNHPWRSLVCGTQAPNVASFSSETLSSHSSSIVQGESQILR